METCLSRGTKRLVPWKKSEEWRKVYINVFSADVEKKRYACEVLKNWSSRFTNDLSMALKLTQLLTEAQLLDHDNNQQKQIQLTDSQISTQYAYAITRFVNDLLESMQDKMFQVSLTRLAKKMGMPERLVLMRHACTHGELSSVPELRSACVDALMFLKKHYWEAQIFHYNGICQEGSAKKDINKKRHFSLTQDKEEEDEEDVINGDDDYLCCDEVSVEKVVDEEEFQEEYKKYIQDGMRDLMHEYLLSMQEACKQSRIVRRTKMTLNSMELFLQSNSDQSIQCIASNPSFWNSIRNSQGVPTEWQPLLKLIKNCDLLAVLVLKLLLILEEDDEDYDYDDERNEKIMWWCIVILKNAQNEAGQSSLYERARDLVEEVVSRYNPYSHELLHLLLPFCIPRLTQQNIEALDEFSCTLNNLNNDPLIFDKIKNDDYVKRHSNVDVEVDERSKRVKENDKSINGEVNNNCIVDLDPNPFNFTDSVTRETQPSSTSNDIMLLKLDSAMVPKGIKSLSFYEMLPQVPVFKKRKKKHAN